MAACCDGAHPMGTRTGMAATAVDATNHQLSGYSGVVRAGDPFSLLADDAGLRYLPFDWRIPIDRGLVDYVSWFKGQVR